MRTQRIAHHRAECAAFPVCMAISWPRGGGIRVAEARAFGLFAVLSAESCCMTVLWHSVCVVIFCMGFSAFAVFGGFVFVAFSCVS